MATIKKEIFLASRFEEFKEIREKLSEKITVYNFMEAIDLNDNQSSHRSPLEESLFHARKAEIMILLVGETYGTVPEGEKKSYTNLEYAEAAQESSNTRVLVICIGEPYAGKFIEYSKTDTKLKEWQIELEKNHRLSKFGNKDNTDEIVEKIMIMLLSSVYELNPDEDLILVRDEELYLEDISNDDNFLHDEEVDFLDNRLSEQNDIDITDTSDDKTEGFELLKIPGKLAALEQKKEAQIAIEIQDYYTARMHLKKALEFRPLDFETNYWLAKLYVASAKKNLFFEIEEYLLRAAKIAMQENNKFKASHCYQLIIQASIFSDKENEGRKYIELAEEITPNFARLYYEKAKFLLYFGHKKEAKHALSQAMNIRMEILKEIARDPFFLEYQDVISELKIEMKDHLKKSCYAISSQTNSIKKILGYETKPINVDKYSIYELWKNARRNFIEQYKIISNGTSSVNDNDIDNIKREFMMYESEHEGRLQSEEREHNQILDQIAHRSLEKIDSFHENVKSVYSASILVLILSLAISVGLVFQGISLEFLWIPTLVLFASAGSVYYIRKLKIEKQEKLNEAEGYETQVEQNRYNHLVSKMKQNFIEFQKETEERVEETNTLYVNIQKAFKIFEEGTVSKSSSKLVPFKSLNNASYGNIIRITPSSYKKYGLKDKILTIEEGFPEVINIDAIDTEEFSFLAKVTNKKYDSLTVSRFAAYKSKSQPKHQKNENNRDLVEDV